MVVPLFIYWFYYEANSSIPFTETIKGNAIGEIVRGKKEGKHIKYYNDGKILSKAYFKQNNLHGDYLEFFQNGNTLTKKITLMVELKEKS